MSPHEIISTLVLAIFASSGLWTLINNIYQNRQARKSIERQALLGLLHEQLVERCEKYISNGWVSLQDYEDLTNYIYKPYTGLGGNGTGEALYNKVTKLDNQQPEKVS